MRALLGIIVYRPPKSQNTCTPSKHPTRLTQTIPRRFFFLKKGKKVESWKKKKRGTAHKRRGGTSLVAYPRKFHFRKVDWFNRWTHFSRLVFHADSKYVLFNYQFGVSTVEKVKFPLFPPRFLNLFFAPRQILGVRTSNHGSIHISLDSYGQGLHFACMCVVMRSRIVE